LNPKIKFKAQGKEYEIIYEESSALSIDYLRGNPTMKINIYTNQDKKEKPKYSISIPKDSYRWIKIQFDKGEIVGFRKNANPVVIGKLDGSALLELKEEGEPFKIVRIYNTKAEKARWEQKWSGSDKIEQIGVDKHEKGTSTQQEQLQEPEDKAKREPEDKAKREPEDKAKREPEDKAKREAEDKAKREPEDKAKREAETKRYERDPLHAT
jgi:hypothetical protein